MTRYFILIVFFGLVFSLNAQEKYSEPEISSFINVYFSEKEIKSLDDKMIEEIFQKHNISKEKYTELIKDSDKSSSRNENIKSFEQEILVYENQYELLKENEIKKLCISNNISLSKYRKIKHDFQNDLKFHRSLKSNIKKHLNNKIDE